MRPTAFRLRRAASALALLPALVAASPTARAATDDTNPLEQLSSAANVAAPFAVAGAGIGYVIGFFFGLPALLSSNSTGFGNTENSFGEAFAAAGGVIGAYLGYRFAGNHDYLSELSGFGGTDTTGQINGAVGGGRLRVSIFELSVEYSTLPQTITVKPPRIYGGIHREFHLVRFAGHHFLAFDSTLGGGTIGSPAAFWGIGFKLQLGRAAVRGDTYFFVNSVQGNLGNPLATGELGLSFSL